MATPSPMKRPDYLSPDWFRCTDGLTIRRPVPEYPRTAAALNSPNPWDRVVHVLLRAQDGEFRGAEILLDIIGSSADAHLRDCAIRAFSSTAPSAVLGRLAEVFEHPDVDTRDEAYVAASLTGDLRLAQALANHRARVPHLAERERVMAKLSNMLEPWVDDPELMDSPLDDESYKLRVHDMIGNLEGRFGKGAFIYRGEPVDARKLVSKIAELAGDEEEGALDYNSGTIAALFELVEAMTGIPYAGCLDHECMAVVPKISYTLNSIRQSGILDKLEPGHRYFFGHRIP